MSDADDKQNVQNLLNDLHMEKIPIEQIKPNPANPRVALCPGMPIYEKLKESIDNFNYIDPIIWNRRTGMIVSGHQRFTVMKAIAEERGIELTEVPVVVVDMDEKDQNVLTIGLNRITGLWDNAKLAALFREMDDADRRLTGYEDFEIEAMLDDGNDDEPTDIPDDEPEITREKKVKTMICPNCGKSFEV